MKTGSLIPFAAMALAACAGASESGRAAGETAIPYAGGDGIIDWKVSGRDSLYIQGMNGHWYLVRTTSVCPRLKTAIRLGFEPSAGNQLDRHSAILAEGQRCQIASVTRAAGPPPKGRDGRGG